MFLLNTGGKFTLFHIAAFNGHAPTARPSHSIAVAIPDSTASSLELFNSLGAHKVLRTKNVPKVITPS
jgi:hypothetical protein